MKQSTFLGLGPPVCHFYFQRTACYDIVMRKEWFIQWFSVQCHAFDILILFELFLAITVNFCHRAGLLRLYRMRASDRINRFPRTYLIESHRIEYIPSRHLSAIFISRQSVYGIGILATVYAVYQFLRPPRTVHIVVHMNHVVAGFVAVGILSDQSADVRGGCFAFQ